MKRSPMRRTRFKTKRKDPAKAKAWLDVKRALWARSLGCCEVPWCHRQANDAHHVKKRSQGGADTLRNTVALCRLCHDATDFATDRGRIIIKPWSNTVQYGFRFVGPRNLQNIGPFPVEDP